MKKLTIAQKLMISNLLYVVPIIALTYFMYDARTADINFAKLEIVGNTYETPVVSLLEHISKHKIVAQRALHGDVQAKSELSSIESQVDEDLKSVSAVDEKYKTILKFTDTELAKRKEDTFKYSKVFSQWTELKSKLAGLKPEESNDLHTSLIANIRGIIVHMGNSSNLILDPDLDTYYLTDGTLGGLPQIQDRIQEITAYTEPVLRANKLGQDERAQIFSYSILLQGDLDRITGDVQTALNEDENFNGVSETLQKNLPPVTKELSDSVSDLVAKLKDLAAGKSVKVDAFLASADKSFASSFHHFSVSVVEDSVLLGKRIDSFSHVRHEYVLMGLLILLVAGLASFFVGRSLRAGILDSLTQVVSQLSETAQSTGSTSSHILDNSQKLAFAATEQAAALQQTVSALTEINAMVAKSRDNAANSVKVVAKSQDSAVQGKNAVENMVRSINEISASNDSILAQTDESNRKIEDIVKVINEIANKTKVINDIVFQTKLLSFNASVEAARAGEHGKGFAVVAEEVGNLAQMSGSAAKEISDMLGTSTQTVASIVNETKTKISVLVTQAKTKVEDGKKTAQYCGEVLNQIVGSVDEVTDLVNEIATAAAEQARGTEEITKAMHKLDEVTQTNSTMSNETNAHASDLADQSKMLLSIVKVIETEVFGGNYAKSVTHASESTTASNVHHLKTHKKPTLNSAVSVMKRAVGSHEGEAQEAIPSKDDPRFQDV